MGRGSFEFLDNWLRQIPSNQLLIHGDFLNHLDFHTEGKLFEFLASWSPSIRSIGGAPSRVASLIASREKEPVVMKQAFISTTHSRATKVAYRGRANHTLIPLALKDDMKAHDSVNSGNPLTVYTSIATASGNFDLDKSRLSQECVELIVQRRRAKAGDVNNL